MKFLLLFMGSAFFFALNIEPGLSEKIDLTFNGVSDQANIELAILFLKVAGINYVLEMGCRYMKFGKLFGWI
jgi:hypothetical protein